MDVPVAVVLDGVSTSRPYTGVNVSSKIVHDGGQKTSRKIQSSSAGKTKRRCPYCPFSSYYSASLTVHLRRHTGEKPYQCIYCHKVFGDRSNMNSHVRRYHREGKARKAVSSQPPGVVQPLLINESPQVTSCSSSNATGIPSIESVYSKDIPGSSSYVTVRSPSGFTNKLHEMSIDCTPSMVCAALPLPASQKVNRRKPTVVRKQIPSQFLGANENIFTSQEENLFMRLNSESQSDEEQENLHAFHTSDQVSNESFMKGERDEDARPPFESSSDGRVTDDETKNENRNPTCSLSDIDDLYSCDHCNIFFKSCVLHTLHKGCHAHDDPFKCNFCGARCKDAIEFHCHFARGNHNGEL